ncbi:hypothetical protein OD917_10240 [Flavobacterium sp. SH_e]|uniref:DMP19 family protein n=1 Tax=Flavobacterium sp. SH_e TaxID=2983767 RepID=UPI0021E4E1D7|nr:hypothetical protein [Flavobacterium sp. SH_e]MCV2485304.1 hypothetical protein [Flavobacterium sp. SH_e]
MNFVDKTLDNLHEMTVDDVIQSMSNIYNEPIDNGELFKYPQFIRDIIFIINLDTEMNMQGDVLQNSIREDVPNIIIALQNIRAFKDAEILQEIYNRYLKDPDDETIDELYSKMYLYNDDFDLWKLLEIYVEKEMVKYKS